MPGKLSDAAQIHLLVDERQALRLLVPWEAEEAKEIETAEAVEESTIKDAP
jgi:hypothetical protein